MLSNAARPAAAETTPTSKETPSAGPYNTGSHTLRTRESSAALRAISGPMPAGSPTVIATRGFISVGSDHRLPRPRGLSGWTERTEETGSQTEERRSGDERD